MTVAADSKRKQKQDEAPAAVLDEQSDGSTAADNAPEVNQEYTEEECVSLTAIVEATTVEAEDEEGQGGEAEDTAHDDATPTMETVSFTNCGKLFRWMKGGPSIADTHKRLDGTSHVKHFQQVT